MITDDSTAALSVMRTVPAPERRSVRVLQIVNGEDFGGAERIQDILGLHLSNHGYRVTFLCVKPDRFERQRVSQNVPFYAYPMRTRFDLRPVPRVARFIRRGGYALVHTHSPRTLLIGRLAAALAKVPVVHHVHCPARIDTTSGWRNRVNVFIERTFLTGVSAAIPVSESVGRYMRQQGIGNDKLTVIPNAVPILGPLPDRPQPSGLWTIGICALFRPRKGIEILLRALAKLKRDGYSLQLRAFGYFTDSDYEPYIKTLVSDLELHDVVHWRGFSNNIYEELKAMDLFVYPSTHGEGLPIAILEAMAAGVPVVGTAVEGTPEAVRDGINGVIAEPNNVDALANGFRRILSGELDWNALRVSAHRRQAECYSDTRLAADVAGVYDRVLRSKVSPAPSVHA